MLVIISTHARSGDPAWTRDSKYKIVLLVTYLPSSGGK